MMFPKKLITALLLICSIHGCSSIHCYKFEQKQQGGEIYKSAKLQVDCGENTTFCWSLNREDVELNVYEEDCPDMSVENGVCEEAACRHDKDTKICCCNTDYCNSMTSRFFTVGTVILLLGSLIF